MIHNFFSKHIYLFGLCLALGFITSSCDEDESTTPNQEVKDDIVALATKSNYSSLVAALKKAELDDDLMAAGPFTVFAPTNAAFTQLFKDLNVSGLDDLTKEQLAPILLYHVVSGKVLSTGLPADSAATLNGQKILIKASDLTINGSSKIVTPIDVEASNGVIHTIDKVLLPSSKVEEDKSIAGLAQATADLSTLVEALKKAELVETFSRSGNFTVFAPTNKAFADAGIDLNTVSKEDLINILNYHVIASKVVSTVLSNGFFLTVNGEYVEANVDNGVKINGAAVTSPDIEASNGVIHIIDKVLVPAAGSVVDIAVAASQASAPEFKSLVAAVTKAGLVETLSAAGDLTVFAPTDAAFASLLDFLGASSLDDVDAELLKEILLYHVVAGNRVFSTQLQTGDLTTQLTDQKVALDATELTLNDAGTLGKAKIDANGINIQANNGVIHTIDKVLLPARSIMDLVNFNGEFSTLKAAIEKAELSATLANTESKFTVFAPTDAAFTAYLEANNLSAADLLNSPNLKSILLYHVIGAEVLAADVKTAFVATVNGQAVKTDITNGVKVIDVNAATPDATVAIPDVKAANGVVHAVDQVLIPELENDIVALASATADLSTLVNLLGNYPDLIASLSDDDGNFTVFAPTNAAFAEITSVTNGLTAEQIKEVLQYHVLSGRVFSTDLTDGQEATMLNQEKVMVKISGSVKISDNSVTSTEDATVSTPDVQALNGVVHIVDKVLIPEL